MKKHKPTAAPARPAVTAGARPGAPVAPASHRAQRPGWTIRLDLRPPHKSTLPLGCGGEGGCA